MIGKPKRTKPLTTEPQIVEIEPCNERSHAMQKWLHVLAPDLSILEEKAHTEMGVWYDCKRCKSTLLDLTRPLLTPSKEKSHGDV